MTDSTGLINMLHIEEASRILCSGCGATFQDGKSPFEIIVQQTCDTTLMAEYHVCCTICGRKGEPAYLVRTAVDNWKRDNILTPAEKVHGVRPPLSPQAQLNYLKIKFMEDLINNSGTCELCAENNPGVYKLCDTEALGLCDNFARAFEAWKDNKERNEE